MIQKYQLTVSGAMNVCISSKQNVVAGRVYRFYGTCAHFNESTHLYPLQVAFSSAVAVGGEGVLPLLLHRPTASIELLSNPNPIQAGTPG
jgi:hypothetical protein